MNTALQAYEVAARLGVALVINSLWQGVAIALITWTALRFFPHANASTRYAAWLVALLAMLVVPVLTSIAHVHVRSAVAPTTSVARYQDTRNSASQATHSLRQKQSSSRRQATSGEPRTASSVPQPSTFQVVLPKPATLLIFSIWVLGALVLVARLVLALLHLEQLKRESLPLGIEQRDALPIWQAAAKGERDVRICVCNETEVPVAVGLFDAMILLPTNLMQQLEAQDVDRILLHELAHLLRGDDWTNGLQRLANALLFFSPAMWFVAHQLDIEREVACDDRVLELTGAIRSYAMCLTRMAEMTAWPHRPLAAPGVFMTRKNISIRIERLLAVGRTFGSTITPGIVGIVSLTLLALLVLLRNVAPSFAYESDTATPVVSRRIATKPAERVALAAPAAVHPTEQPRATAEPRATQVPVVVSVRQRAIRVSPPPVPRVPTLRSSGDIPAFVSAVTSAALGGAAKAIASTNGAYARSGGCIVCDYSHKDLAGSDFRGQSFEGADFSHANLRGANFSHANLSGADFHGADLRDVSFVGANLTGCDLRGAKLKGARFDGAHVTGSEINASDLAPLQAQALLRACTGCDFSNANLSGTDLRNIRVVGTSLRNADLRNADLSGASFSGVDLRGARLTGARLDGAKLTGCDFDGTDLRGVDLSKVSIIGSSLRDARLQH